MFLATNKAGKDFYSWLPIHARPPSLQRSHRIEIYLKFSSGILVLIITDNMRFFFFIFFSLIDNANRPNTFQICFTYYMCKIYSHRHCNTKQFYDV